MFVPPPLLPIKKKIKIRPRVSAITNCPSFEKLDTIKHFLTDALYTSMTSVRVYGVRHRERKK